MKNKYFILIVAFVLSSSLATWSAQTLYSSTAVAQAVPQNTWTTYQTISATTTTAGVIQVTTEANGNNGTLFRIQVDDTTVGSNGTPSPGGGYTFNINGQSAELTPGSHTITVQAQGLENNSRLGGLSTIVTFPSEPEPSAAQQIANLSNLLSQINAALNSGNAAILAALQAQTQAINTALNTTIASLQTQLATQGSQITALTGQITALTDQVTQLQEQLAQGQPNAATRSSGKSGLKDWDYAIVGGIAAGTTGLGIGIYSLLDQPSEGDPQEERPAY
jgi:hypothetical protein